jgi:hypothetical protein
MISRLLLSISVFSVLISVCSANSILAASVGTIDAGLYEKCDPVNDPRSCPGNVEKAEVKEIG